MRLIRSTIYGITPAFRDAPVTLEAAALPGLLCAVVGGNGCGKSTLLASSLIGAIDRVLPKLGGVRTTPLAALAQCRGAYVESTFDMGGRLGVMTFRQVVDNAGERAESLVLGADGRPYPSLPTTSVRACDAWVNDNLPAYQVRVASVYLGQQNTGLVRLSPGDRKAVILRAIGAEQLERKARACSRRAATAAESLATLTGAVAAARDGVGSVADARSARDAAVVAHTAAVLADERAAGVLATSLQRAALATRRADAAQRLAGLTQAHDAAVVARGDADAAAGDVVALAAIDARLAAATTAHDAAARDAAGAARDVQRAQQDRDAASVRLDATAQRYRDDGARLHGDRDTTARTLATSRAALANNRAVVADAQAIRAAAARLVVLDAAIVKARAALARLEADAAACEARLDTAGARERVAQQRAQGAARRRDPVVARLAGRGAVDDAQAGLPAATTEVGVAADAVVATRQRWEALREAAARQWERRHGGLRVALVTIAADGDVSD